MKTFAKYTLLGLACVGLLTACDENDWNDDLDGFEVPGIGTSTSSLTYTLTAADYTKIATTKPYTTYAADNDQTAELTAVGSSMSFPTEEMARTYLAMFLRDSTNTFFTLANGSSIKLSYNVDTDIPEVVQAINAGVKTYTVTEADYQKAWGSDEDYIAAYAPATPASRFIPSLLKSEFPDAVSGDYAVVTFDQADTNPVFGSVGGGDDTFEPSDELGGAGVGDEVDVKGWITAVCTRGFIVSDKGGSILCYGGSSFDASAVSVGMEVEVTGEVSAYGTGLQIAISDNYTILGAGSYTYPTPVTYTGAMMDEAVARTDDFGAIYCQFTGTASVGSYINFTVDGAETAQGSAYYCPSDIKAQLVDGQKYTIVGYFSSVSSGRYFNVIITEVLPAGSANKRQRTVASAPVAYTTCAIYTYNGSSWSVPANTVVLTPADYTAMGQSYGNLSGTLPTELLPIYLKQNYPYAVADDEVTIAYKYYASSATTYQAQQYVYNGSEWVRQMGETSAQFVKKDGYWFFNPSVILTLPYSRNTDPSYTYYMACVNWVFDNISAPQYGSTSLGDAAFIDYRGNAEFYSGASAYYGNVDVRATTAVNNAPDGYTGYDGLTDEEIVLLVEKRFCLETMPGALRALHPDAAPIEGMEVTYTINFTAYETGGVAVERVLVYEVTAPGTFTYRSCTWFENGEDADW